MAHEDTTRIEEMLTDHVAVHDADYKKLLWAVIAVLFGLVGTTATWFISIGHMEEKVTQLEAAQQDKVSRQEMLGSMNLIDERFRNINEKLDDIKRGLNIR